MRYAVISDVHSNFSALQAVHADVENLRKREDVIDYLFLGDLVGYGPAVDAAGCLRWARANLKPSNWVPGNHDEWMASQIGRYAGEAMVTLLAQDAVLRRPESAEDFHWFLEEVKTKLSDFRGDLEALLTRKVDGHNGDPDPYVVVGTHGSLERDVQRSEYLYVWQPALIEAAINSFRSRFRMQTGCLLHGHTHFPSLCSAAESRLRFHSLCYGRPIKIDGVFAINPGSVGQPRDGDPRASYALIDPHEKTVEFRRVAYDFTKVTGRMGLEKLPISNKNPLTRPERKQIIERLGKLDGMHGTNAIYKQWEDAYNELIYRLITADGREGLARYKAVYRRSEQGLEVTQDGCS